MGLGKLFLSLDGRIGRGRWWAASIVLWLLGAVVAYVNWIAIYDKGITFEGPSRLEILTWVVLALLVWPYVAVQAKRWHDRGKSAWWMLIGAVPVVGAIWVLVELGFLAGDAGPNEYGATPVTRD